MSEQEQERRVRVTFEGRVTQTFKNGAFYVEAFTGVTNGMTGEPVESWLCVRPDSDVAPSVTVEYLDERDHVAEADALRKQVEG